MAHTHRIWIVTDAADAARAAKVARVGDAIWDRVNSVAYQASNTGTAVAVGAAPGLATTSVAGIVKKGGAIGTISDSTGGTINGALNPTTDFTTANDNIHYLANRLTQLINSLQGGGIIT